MVNHSYIVLTALILSGACFSPSGTIQGTILDENYHTIADVTIRNQHGPDTVWAMSDERGAYKLKLIDEHGFMSAGHEDLILFDKLGYKKWEFELSIGAQVTETFNILLPSKDSDLEHKFLSDDISDIAIYPDTTGTCRNPDNASCSVIAAEDCPVDFTFDSNETDC